MATVSERARKLASEFVTWAASGTPMDDLAEQYIAITFEQALLAERRLAFEEALAICEKAYEEQLKHCDKCAKSSPLAGLSAGIYVALRAAAETEKKA